MPLSTAQIADILKSAKTIAIVGASSDASRSSNSIMRILQDTGYRCIPVNPNETNVNGETAYARLEDIPVPVDIVNVFRRPTQTPHVATSAVAIGAKCLWLQMGIANAEAEKIAADGGLAYIEDACIAVLLRVTGIDKI